MLPAPRLMRAAITFRLLTTTRSFKSFSEYDTWRRDVRASSLPLTSDEMQPLSLAESAPFLHSVSAMADHLEVSGVVVSNNMTKNQPKSPRQSLLQCKYPLARDALLRNSVTDFSKWTPFRLGKGYELADALTADVAYRHCGDPHGTKVTLVTAGHYNSRKLQRTDIHRDLYVRSYVTNVGTSSMELRTDAIQLDENSGKEVLVNVCHTIMVALDKETEKPLGKVGKRIPPLEIKTLDDQKRQRLAQQHANIRKHRSSCSMQLREAASKPPTLDEFAGLHKLHHKSNKQKQVADGAHHEAFPRMADFTFRSSTVIFPENRNVHGKLFGGFIMEEAEKLAQYTAMFCSKGKPIVPLGIDEALFLHPVEVGNLVTFTAQLVHSTPTSCRVLVLVEVRDPAHPDCIPLRSNRLMFVYGGSHFSGGVIPETYSEILVHMDARRRHEMEGPTEDEVQAILDETKMLAGPMEDEVQAILDESKMLAA